ncbi:hypothetical protein VPH35_096631 [Triticum aestivum]
MAPPPTSHEALEERPSAEGGASATTTSAPSPSSSYICRPAPTSSPAPGAAKPRPQPPHPHLLMFAGAPPPLGRRCVSTSRPPTRLYLVPAVQVMRAHQFAQD